MPSTSPAGDVSPGGLGPARPAVDLSPRVVAVVVAFDRRELLVEALAALAAQTRPVDALVLVDNASTDGSGEAALALAVRAGLPLDLVTLPRNTGGTGGFAAGIARALVHHDPDLLWLMDDDTVPGPAALAALLDARRAWTEAGPGGGSRARRDRAARGSSVPPSPGSVPADGPALLASRVVWTDGREHPMNTPRPRPFATAAERRRAAAAGAVAVRSASFVSVLLDAGAVRRVGLPVAAYFLWNDDFEMTTRVLRGRAGLHVGASVVEHRTRVFGDARVDPGPRFRFEVRNKVWLLTRSRSLAPWEKALYGGATLRRWARTTAASDDRATLLRAGLAGLREARLPPPPTPVVLAGLGPVSDDVVAVEAAVRAGAPGRRGRLRTATGAGPGPGAERPRPAAVPPPSVEGAPFSLLLPVYAGDDPDHLARALVSATTEQTRRPAEVVLVRDGPLPAALDARVGELVAASPVPVRMVALERNVGLAMALDAGLAACDHDLVARMDADDVALPQRFAVQLPLLEAGADLVGSALEEMADDDSPPGTGAVRRQPPDAAWIAARARFHSPFNHPTVVYRRSAVAAAGGYRTLAMLEDYWLFARMIAAGAVCANVPDVLLRYRVGAGSYDRRGGWALARSELALQRHLLAEGFVTPAQFARNVVGARGLPSGAGGAAARGLPPGVHPPPAAGGLSGSAAPGAEPRRVRPTSRRVRGPVPRLRR